MTSILTKWFFFSVVPVLEASVIIAISSAHRREALDATSFAIDTLKAMVPIWKKVRLGFVHKQIKFLYVHTDLADFHRFYGLTRVVHEYCKTQALLIKSINYIWFFFSAYKFSGCVLAISFQFKPIKLLCNSLKLGKHYACTFDIVDKVQ